MTISIILNSTTRCDESRLFAQTEQFIFKDEFIKSLPGLFQVGMVAVASASGIIDCRGARVNGIQLVQVSDWVFRALKNKKLCKSIGHVQCVNSNVTKFYSALPGIFTMFQLGQENCPYSCEDMKQLCLRKALIELFLELLEQQPLNL